jgi:hypothetical protein
LSIKKADGTEYEPSSLRNIISSIDRKLQRNKYPFLIMRGNGPQFSLTRDALKAKQKCLKKLGKGNKPRVASSLFDKEVDQIVYQRWTWCHNTNSITQHCLVEQLPSFWN